MPIHVSIKKHVRMARYGMQWSKGRVPRKETTNSALQYHTAEENLISKVNALTPASAQSVRDNRRAEKTVERSGNIGSRHDTTVKDAVVAGYSLRQKNKHQSAASQNQTTEDGSKRGTNDITTKALTTDTTKPQIPTRVLG